MTTAYKIRDVAFEGKLLAKMRYVITIRDNGRSSSDPEG